MINEGCRSARSMLGACLVLGLLAAPLQAQEDAPGGRRAPEIHAGDLRTIVDAVARRCGVRILVDPAIVLAVRPGVPDGSLTVDEALDAIAAPLKSVAWRRVYLTRSQPVPPPDRLAAAVRLVDRPDLSSLLLENTTTKRATTFLKDRALPDALGADPRTGPFDPAPVYLLYSVAAPADGRTDEERFGDLQREELELMARLAPGQRANPMLHWARLLQNHAPAEIEQAMTPMLQAGMQIWERTAPAQRTEMMQQAVQVMHSFGGGGAGSTPGGADIAANADMPENYLRDLKRIAADLAERHGVQIVVDPTIWLGSPPAALDRNRTIEQAMDTLTALSRDLAWRRVYLHRAQGAGPISDSHLVRTVRLLDRLNPGGLIVENPLTRRATTYRRGEIALPDSGDARQAGPFRTRPIYVLYSVSAAGEGEGPIAQRYADLQGEQMEILLNMNADQLAQAMDQALQTYQGGDSATRLQVMGLPVMAGMMAVWFPRAAHERRDGQP